MNKVMPSTCVSCRLQAADDLAGAGIALFERLQIDLDAAAVQRGVGAVHADERGQAFHRRIFQDDVCQRLLALRPSR